MFRIPFPGVKTVDIRNKPIAKLHQHNRERDFPCGLQNFLCTLAPAIARKLPRSALGPTLDTGGRLTLTRQGIAPRKRHRALLGAITLSLKLRAPR